MKKTALVIGSTGFVGMNLLNLLLSDDFYSKVTVLIRKKLNFKHNKLRQEIINFDNIERYSRFIKGDDVFCCIGTTIKKAGSEEAFYKVDYTYAQKIAETAQKNGASQFIFISSVGSNPNSRSFYLRTKGELEKSIKELPFNSISALRPSLLTGKREEFRFAEKSGHLLSKIIVPLLIGPLKKYKPIKANSVAMVMRQIAKENNTGYFIYESDKIQKKFKSIYYRK